MNGLSSQKISTLEEIYKRKIGLECAGSIGIFIEKYIRCEALATKMISYYTEDSGKPKPKVLQINQIKAAFKYYNITHLEPLEIEKIFSGGEGKRGSKSARQLRNGFLHSLSPNDRKEIEDNISYLTVLMDKFISLFMIESPPEFLVEVESPINQLENNNKLSLSLPDQETDDSLNTSTDRT